MTPTAMTVQLREIAPEDADWLEAENNAAVPNVNALSGPALIDLAGQAAYRRIALDNGQPVGFLIAFAPGADYRSQNYVWFSGRYDDFLYIDRVVVADAARGRGIGGILYQDLFDFALGKTARITCEVNEKPPNPGSIRFHERLGFTIVGRQETEAGAKSVALMARDL